MEFIKRTTAVILAVGIMTTPQALAVEREPLNFEERCIDSKRLMQVLL